jgi:ankyrin repeat protein
MSNDLLEAVENNDLVQVKQLLSEYASLANAGFPGERTILHKAVFQGNASIVELLLKAGAEVNAPAADGNTPLHVAAAEGRFEAGRTLVDWGANLEVRNKRGETPLFCASCSGREESQALAALFLDRGVSLDFNSAVCLGKTNIVQDRLKEDSAAWKSAIDPHAPLWDAVRVQSADLVKLLLEHGFSPDSSPNNHAPPLFLAVSRSDGDIKILRLLLEHGASIQARNHAGESILSWAKEVASPEMIALLKNHGATD